MTEQDERHTEALDLTNSILRTMFDFTDKTSLSTLDTISCILNALANCAGRTIVFFAEDLSTSLHYTDTFLKNVRASLPVHLEEWREFKEEIND